jgi:hypothetical protein
MAPFEPLIEYIDIQITDRKNADIQIANCPVHP